ncbi:hypothetical protein GCM10010531_30080 [Blastococcus jejuensis]|uniref:Uncharacterized protein n=1 Tax=Blastococcus jejuensis TaxID=351224 RepID=A0ABP6PCA2_9ACTN
MTRSGDGELLVVFATCGAEYEGVQLGAGPLARSDDEETATWRHEGDIDDATSLPLTAADPGDEWTVVAAWSGVEDETYGYDLRAGQLTSDERGIDFRSPVSSAFAFPGTLLTELEPGELLHRDFGGSREVIVDRRTVQEFRSSVCGGS